MRDARGQGTVEWIGIVLLVALVLAAAIAVVSGSGVGERVTAAMRRALCIVTGEECGGGGREAVAVELSPCVIAALEQRDSRHVTLTIVRLGASSTMLRERLADGTVRLTLLDELSAGIEVGAGAGGSVRWGERSFAVGNELRAAALAGTGSGRTWVASDEAAADRMYEQIRLAALAEEPEHRIDGAPDLTLTRPPVEAPEPRFVFSERTSDLELDLQLRNRAAAKLAAETAYGERLDRETGERTVYVHGAQSGEGKIAFGRSGAVEGEAQSSERYAITYDREGRPVDFAVLSTLDAEGTVSLPPRLAAVAGWLSVPSGGERHVETEQHLDLTDPGNAALAEAFLAAPSAVELRVVAQALTDRLDAAGAQIRTYSSEDDGRAIEGYLKAGVGAGGGMSSETQEQTLLAAVRGSGGAWERDPACAAA